MSVLVFLLVNLFCRGSNAREGSPDSRVFSSLAGGGIGFGAPVFLPTCPAKGVRSFPSYDRCDTYHECVEGVRELKECPHGLLHNPDRANDTEPCDPPSDIEDSVLYGCAPDLYELLPCPALGVTTTADADQCDKYYTCVQGVLQFLQCPAGLLYNPDHAKDAEPCDLPSNLEMHRFQRCYPAYPRMLFCPDKGATTISDFNACGSYYECFEGSEEFKECPAGLLYNPNRANDTEPCDPPSFLKVSRILECSLLLIERLDSSTIPTSAPAPPPPKCIKPFPHHLPDEGDDHCRGFYQCRGGEAEAFHRECPDGLLYNARAAANTFPCDYPENVSCSSPSALPPSSLPPPSLSPPPPHRFQQDGEREKPTKVFNFYTHVTHHW